MDRGAVVWISDDFDDPLLDEFTGCLAIMTSTAALEELVQKYQALPSGLQQQAVDFLGFLLDRYLADQRAGVELETLGKSFSASPVVKLTVEELMGMARQFFELPELDWRDADEILGYDEVGLPS